MLLSLKHRTSKRIQNCQELLTRTTFGRSNSGPVLQNIIVCKQFLKFQQSLCHYGRCSFDLWKSTALGQVTWSESVSLRLPVAALEISWHPLTLRHWLWCRSRSRRGALVPKRSQRVNQYKQITCFRNKEKVRESRSRATSWHGTVVKGVMSAGSCIYFCKDTKPYSARSNNQSRFVLDSDVPV